MTTNLSGRPHLLFVAWGFPPMAGGGTYRTLATANVMTEAGFDVTVLTTQRDAFVGFTGVDDALVNEIDPRITVIRIPFENPLTEWDIRRWPQSRLENPKDWVANFRENGLDFPELTFGQWLKPLLAAADEIHAARPVDLVMGSANPHVVLSVGDHLHHLHGIPYVIDHRDAWRLNCYLGTEAGADNPEIARLETRYMNNALEIWFVNDAILRWHQERYPEAASRMRVVENGYDAAFAPQPTLETPPPDKPLKFSYVGTIGFRVPIAEFVEGWVDARNRSDDIKAAQAFIYGPIASADNAKHQLLTAAQKYGVTHAGPVHKEDVAQVYESSDVLLLIIGGGRFVTSGKVYEYLAAGLPIVSIHDPENGAKEVLKGYPLWFPVDDLSVAGVSAALVTAAEAARTATPEVRQACAEFGRRGERLAQLEEPARELYATVTARRAGSSC